MSSIYENNRKWPMIECRVSDEEKKVMERIAEDMYSKRIIKYPTVTSFVKFAAKIMVKYYISEKQKEIAQKEAEVARLEEAESKTRIAAQKGPPPALQDLKEATNELFNLRKQLIELSSAYSSYQHATTTATSYHPSPSQPAASLAEYRGEVPIKESKKTRRSISINEMMISDD